METSKIDGGKKLWFKRRLFGWGWCPCSWQGWVVTLGYVVLVAFFAFTIDENSSDKEVVFTFLLPLVFLTLTLLRIAYKTGEKPRWQWGKRRED